MRGVLLTTMERPLDELKIVVDPVRTICLHCLAPVLQVAVDGHMVLADPWEWLPRQRCQSCQWTRRAHPHLTHVHCANCGDTGYVGEKRPRETLLAIDVAWSDESNLRLITAGTRRRRGEGLYKLHHCSQAQDRAA